MTAFVKPQPSDALAEMLAQTGELDKIISGHGLSFNSTPPPPAPPAGLNIRELMALDGPVDWEAEAVERLQRDRLERARIAAAELERIAPEDEQPLPAKKRRSWLEKDRRP